MRSPIRYARSGDVNIAYQVTGNGPFDLVLVHGFFSHLELDWELPAAAHFHERLASFARVIRLDKRGTGLSDRGVGLPDFETRMDDVRAVMDAVGSDSAALFGYSEGGPMSVLFAATYPERTRAVVLYGTYAKRCDPDDDYPWAPAWERRAREAAQLEATWGENVDLSSMWPHASATEAAWFQRRGRASGLYGAKITGGGSGGTVVVLGRSTAEPALREVVAEYARETGHTPHVFSGSSPGAAAFGARRGRYSNGRWQLEAYGPGSEQ